MSAAIACCVLLALTWGGAAIIPAAPPASAGQRPFQGQSFDSYARPVESFAGSGTPSAAPATLVQYCADAVDMVDVTIAGKTAKVHQDAQRAFEALRDVFAQHSRSGKIGPLCGGPVLKFTPPICVLAGTILLTLIWRRSLVRVTNIVGYDCTCVDSTQLQGLDLRVFQRRFCIKKATTLTQNTLGDRAYGSALQITGGPTTVAASAVCITLRALSGFSDEHTH